MAKGKILRGAKLEKKISEKRKRLACVKEELKLHFVGIDNIIDQLINYAEVWYSTPEILSRPMIVCLWGPTGVGKTDLVRRFVKLLNYSDRYCEIELANKNTTTWHKSVGSILNSKGLASGEPSIILLDEIQGFRTIDEEKREIQDYDLKDIWTLLSDGRLPYDVDPDNLMAMLWRYNKSITDKEKEKLELISKKKKKKKKSIIDELIGDEGTLAVDDEEVDEWSYYEISHFKEIMRLDEPIEEIAKWDEKKRRDLIVQRLHDKTIYDEEDYSKSLIIISGNIDEAYGFTKSAKEVDLDADLLHSMSTRISILDIKGALGSRFRPEQISRMGNNHIIYPTLAKESFEKIIDRKIVSICSKVKDLASVELHVDPSIRKLVYENGVFPTQGTRPVFSTISEIVECNLPSIIVESLIKEAEEAYMRYDTDKIIMTVGDKTIIRNFVGTLDIIKRKRDSDINRKTISSVHEAGHAVAYAILFGQTPTQIVSTPISDEMEGFVYFKDMELMSKEFLLKKISACLAGHEAEMIVFGEESCSSGNESDLDNATEIAASMVRRSGMYSFATRIEAQESNDLANNNIEESNSDIETIIIEQRDLVRKHLEDYKELLIDTVDGLLASDRISSSEFKDICEKHGLMVLESKANDEPRYWESNKQYEDFKNGLKSSVDK